MFPIIPKFVGKWLKDTSATGYLRQATNPNLRIQDLLTERLLCYDCEGLFSTWEKQFAENIFIPYHSGGKRKFAYEKWLLLFAISLNFRAAIVELESFRQEKPNLATKIDDALADWKATLLHVLHQRGMHIIYFSWMW